MTGNDTTYTVATGVGFYVSGLSGNAFFDYWHKGVLEWGDEPVKMIGFGIHPSLEKHR